MSAWIVSRAHIDVIVQGLAESEIVVNVDPDTMGRALWSENLRSIQYRYPNAVDGTYPGPIDFVEADVANYTYRRPTIKQSREALLTALHCYDYQTCEHPEYGNSFVHRWVSTLVDRLDSTGVSWQSHDAPWGHQESHVHGTGVSA